MPDTIQTILTVLAGLTTGGIISTFATLKYTKKKAKFESDILHSQSELAEINNAKEILEMYRESFKQMQELQQSKESELTKKYQELFDDFEKYKTHASQEITRMTQRIQNLEAENKQLRVLITGSCGNCEFYVDCKKRTHI